MTTSPLSGGRSRSSYRNRSPPDSHRGARADHYPYYSPGETSRRQFARSPHKYRHDDSHRTSRSTSHRASSSQRSSDQESGQYNGLAYRSSRREEESFRRFSEGRANSEAFRERSRSRASSRSSRSSRDSFESEEGRHFQSSWHERRVPPPREPPVERRRVVGGRAVRSRVISFEQKEYPASPRSPTVSPRAEKGGPNAKALPSLPTAAASTSSFVSKENLLGRTAAAPTGSSVEPSPVAAPIATADCVIDRMAAVEASGQAGGRTERAYLSNRNRREARLANTETAFTEAPRTGPDGPANGSQVELVKCEAVFAEYGPWRPHLRQENAFRNLHPGTRRALESLRSQQASASQAERPRRVQVVDGFKSFQRSLAAAAASEPKIPKVDSAPPDGKSALADFSMQHEAKVTVPDSSTPQETKVEAPDSSTPQEPKAAAPVPMESALKSRVAAGSTPTADATQALKNIRLSVLKTERDRRATRLQVVTNTGAEGAERGRKRRISETAKDARKRARCDPPEDPKDVKRENGDKAAIEATSAPSPQANDVPEKAVVSEKSKPAVDVEPFAVSEKSKPAVDVEPSSVLEKSKPAVDVEPSVVSEKSKPSVDVEPSSISKKSKPSVDVEPSAVSEKSKPSVDVEPSVFSEKSKPAVNVEPSAVLEKSKPAVDVEPSVVLEKSKPAVDVEPFSVSKKSKPAVDVEPAAISEKSKPVDDVEPTAFSEKSKPSVDVEPSAVDVEPSAVSGKTCEPLETFAVDIPAVGPSKELTPEIVVIDLDRASDSVSAESSATSKTFIAGKPQAAVVCPVTTPRSSLGTSPIAGEVNVAQQDRNISPDSMKTDESRSAVDLRPGFGSCIAEASPEEVIEIIDTEAKTERSTRPASSQIVPVLTKLSAGLWSKVLSETEDAGEESVAKTTSCVRPVTPKRRHLGGVVSSVSTRSQSAALGTSPIKSPGSASGSLSPRSGGRKTPQRSPGSPRARKIKSEAKDENHKPSRAHRDEQRTMDVDLDRSPDASDVEEETARVAASLLSPKAAGGRSKAGEMFTITLMTAGSGEATLEEISNEEFVHQGSRAYSNAAEDQQADKENSCLTCNNPEMAKGAKGAYLCSQEEVIECELVSEDVASFAVPIQEEAVEREIPIITDLASLGANSASPEKAVLVMDSPAALESTDPTVEDASEVEKLDGVVKRESYVTQMSSDPDLDSIQIIEETFASASMKVVEKPELSEVSVEPKVGLHETPTKNSGAEALETELQETPTKNSSAEALDPSLRSGRELQETPTKNSGAEALETELHETPTKNSGAESLEPSLRSGRELHETPTKNSGSEALETEMHETPTKNSGAEALDPSLRSGKELHETPTKNSGAESLDPSLRSGTELHETPTKNSGSEALETELHETPTKNSGSEALETELHETPTKNSGSEALETELHETPTKNSGAESLETELHETSLSSDFEAKETLLAPKKPSAATRALRWNFVKLLGHLRFRSDLTWSLRGWRRRYNLRGVTVKYTPVINEPPLPDLQTADEGEGKEVEESHSPGADSVQELPVKPETDDCGDVVIIRSPIHARSENENLLLSNPSMIKEEITDTPSRDHVFVDTGFFSPHAGSYTAINASVASVFAHSASIAAVTTATTSAHHREPILTTLFNHQASRTPVCVGSCPPPALTPSGAASNPPSFAAVSGAFSSLSGFLRTNANQPGNSGAAEAGDTSASLQTRPPPHLLTSTPSSNPQPFYSFTAASMTPAAPPMAQEQQCVRVCRTLSAQDIPVVTHESLESQRLHLDHQKSKAIDKQRRPTPEAPGQPQPINYAINSSEATPLLRATPQPAANSELYMLMTQPNVMPSPQPAHLSTIRPTSSPNLAPSPALPHQLGLHPQFQAPQHQFATQYGLQNPQFPAIAAQPVLPQAAPHALQIPHAAHMQQPSHAHQQQAMLQMQRPQHPAPVATPPQAARQQARKVSKKSGAHARHAGAGPGQEGVIRQSSIHYSCKDCDETSNSLEQMVSHVMASTGNHRIATIFVGFVIPTEQNSQQAREQYCLGCNESMRSSACWRKHFVSCSTLPVEVKCDYCPGNGSVVSLFTYNFHILKDHPDVVKDLPDIMNCSLYVRRRLVPVMPLYVSVFRWLGLYHAYVLISRAFYGLCVDPVEEVLVQAFHPSVFLYYCSACENFFTRVRNSVRHSANCPHSVWPSDKRIHVWPMLFFASSESTLKCMCCLGEILPLTRTGLLAHLNCFMTNLSFVCHFPCNTPPFKSMLHLISHVVNTHPEITLPGTSDFDHYHKRVIFGLVKVPGVDLPLCCSRSLLPDIAAEIYRSSRSNVGSKSAQQAVTPAGAKGRPQVSGLGPPGAVVTSCASRGQPGPVSVTSASSGAVTDHSLSKQLSKK